MQTIDEIFAAMPAEAAAVDYEYLVIDPVARTITVPDSEKVFGVESDGNAARKHFLCPRYVGDNLDLAGMFLAVNFRNANGEEEGYLVDDVAVQGEYVTFSWELWPKVTAYKGPVQFAVCADLPNTAEKKRPDWNTTLAEGDVLEGLDPDRGDVEGETSDAMTQLRAEIKASTAAVEATGAAQVDVVKAQGTNTTQEAVAAIQAQGEATRASIPADYTALAATVDRLTRDRAAAIVCQAEGTAIQVQDASNDPLQGLRIFGRSTQDGTPTPDNPVEIVSLAAPVVGVHSKNLLCADSMVNGQFVKNTDGTYTLTKNGTGGLRFSSRAACNLPKGTYTLSVRSVTGTDETVRLALTYENGGEQSLAVTPSTPKKFVAEDRVVKMAAYLPSDKADGEYTTMGGLMLELGDVATAYEPYKGQTLTITAPGSLPGIPVASGGNYTDANGQQWIADEVDLARGVYVQRVGAVTLNASADEYWYTIQATGGTIFANAISDAMAAGSSKKVYCSHFVASVNDTYNKTGDACYFYDKTLRICHMGIDTLDGFKTWLAENLVSVFYQLADPVETSLSDVEVQAFRALCSCKPTTTVLNDTGAHMVLEYAADPKTYIDNKLAALVAASG